MTFQEKFLLLMERVSEPLYQSPRGSSNTFFEVPMDDLCEKKMKAAMDMRKTMQSDKPPIVVPKPKQMPDLSHFGSICPRKGQFLYFVPSHRKLGEELKQILMAQKSMDDLLSMSCACRDSPMINPQLFIYAMSACVLGRKDMRKIRLPPFYEMMPDHFLDTRAVQAAQEIGRMPEEDRVMLDLNSNTTGKNNNPENKLWYFREDIGANSHHFHWHVVFGGNTPEYPEKGSRHRRGELFYYMHHSMIARYDAERLSNGLPRVKPIDLENPMISEGYFGKLYMTNSGVNWGNRQENTELRTVDRLEGMERTAVTLEDLKVWRDRILEAIDTGYILKKDKNGQDVRVKLTPKEGVDILGDLIENSDSLSPNKLFYGPGFHNMGHVLIAFSHDPRHKYREAAGPMGDTSTALRDPAFYRWHKYIDILFEKYKSTLQPHQDVGNDYPLKWNNIQIKSGTVVNSLDSTENILSTYWMSSDIDLARGIDFGRTSKNMLGPVWGRFTHLNYDHFEYRIEVENRNPNPLLSTVRIFMAPRKDENGERFFMAQQHTLFFELDKFSKILTPGKNSITRSSTESSVTISWENSFAQLENRNRRYDTADYPPEEGICGCGWPQHLLLPRGTPEGMEFDVVILLTNGEDDKPAKGQGMSTGNDKEKCRQAMSFCGILDEMYPDSKPMGYPFDRSPFTIPGMEGMDMQIPVTYVDKYAERIPNMITFPVIIVHQPKRKLVRTVNDGGPPTAQMEVTTISGGCGKKPSTGNAISGHTSYNPRTPPRSNPPPQYGWVPGGNSQHGGKQIIFPGQDTRKGRDDQDQEDDYEMIGNDHYRYNQ